MRLSSYLTSQATLVMPMRKLQQQCWMLAVQWSQTVELH